MTEELPFDKYKKIAAAIFKVSHDEVTKEQRRAAKSFFFHSVCMDGYTIAAQAVVEASQEQRVEIQEALQEVLQEHIPYEGENNGTR